MKKKYNFETVLKNSTITSRNAKFLTFIPDFTNI